MAIESLPGDSKSVAQFGDAGFGARKSHHGELDLRGCHLGFPAALPASGTPNDTAARGLDRRPQAGDHPQVDATVHKCVHEVDHVPGVPAKAFKPTDNQRIAVTEGLEAGFKPLTAFLFTARCVAVNFGNASCDEGIALPVKPLRTIRCRDTHVAEEERSMTLF